ncbi:hypothetical protein N7462_004397 [Penicillium macrosclerotiorum]|uniref:uncharacterized protein n=1 Tax=Penicillium macrosclerotiorum TaxID=303699 RepID=UPI0025472D8A|nr:uncharacterized protein N7462_004397 [Penicillium macrosclerotiorum]KAJ5690005.1 hypothetical protein N7462_004397 [Penicillium macrosclerotiorum]
MPPLPDEDDEDYFLPLEDQRVFGAGIRRKRVPFVRSSDHELSTVNPASSTAPGPSIANTYLSIVLKKSTSTPSTPAPQTLSPPLRTTHTAPPSSDTIAPVPPTLPPGDHCEICNLPFAANQPAESSSDAPPHRPHEASLAHQVCLQHSHPPSHLDRTRPGLRYLSTYGWDPDRRLGLGAPGREGIREPLKGRLKNDTAGLGIGLDADGDRIRRPPPPPPKVQKLNAKQMRKHAAEAQKKHDRMRNLFFQRDDVLKYLGEDG